MTMEKPIDVDEALRKLNKNKKPSISWKDKSAKQKLITILLVILKIVVILGCLYFFICSLDLMSLSFRLVGGKSASEAFASDVVTNPIAGLVIGVVVTVIVQSSSTSTSIVVTMVSAGILRVRNAIPIIMGANIGTSITSTLVSLTQATDRENFQRAFAGATVHDCFNLLSVLILLPLELVSHYLERVSELIVQNIKDSPTGSNPDMLNAITKPLTNSIVQLDTKVLEKIATNQALPNETLIKHYCPITTTIILENGTSVTETDRTNKCSFLVESWDMPEWAVGLILLAISLIVLCFCLILLVKILTSIFQGPAAKILQKVINSDFPGPAKYFTGLVAMMIGCGLTIVVQSSSVFTSSIIPLVGMGIVSIERIFPLTLGSNIGTTVTGILAALSSSSGVKNSLQIAFCHTLFNVSGIIIWYPIPFLRKVPINCAKFLGRVSSNYRWFAILYLLISFILVPLSIFGLSFAPLPVMLSILGVILLLIAFILIVNKIQDTRFRGYLPKFLQTWDFLPLPLRSLQPYDKFLNRYICCCACCKKLQNNDKIHPETIDKVEQFQLEDKVEKFKLDEKV